MVASSSSSHATMALQLVGAYPCHDTCRGTLSDAPPPPSPPPLRVMVARPAEVTQVPNPLLHEPLHGIPCHRPPPPSMSWWHKGHR